VVISKEIMLLIFHLGDDQRRDFAEEDLPVGENKRELYLLL
jgi:hypothetical protein